MNTIYEWDLSNLYKGFDDTNFNNDINYIKEKIKELTEFTENQLNNENIIETIEKYINIQNEFGDIAIKLSSFANLTLATDSSNEKALKSIDLIENIFTKTAIPETKFTKWFYTSVKNIDELCEKSELIKEHKYFLKNILDNAKHTLSENEEDIISKFKTTGSSSWEKLWDTITSNHTVEFEGKNIPLAEARNIAYSADAKKRKTAYENEIKSYEKIAQVSASCLNSIKGQVITECELRGYTSPFEMTVKNSGIDIETLNSMIEAMKEYLPWFEKYFIKKAEILGHKKGLPFYDLFAPIGKTDATFTYEEAMDFVIKNFSKFSKDLGEYAEKAYKNHWIDVYPKEGKRGGAFCDNIHSIKESRILTNFTGSFSDVITLAHELGHGYHGQCLDNETFLNSDYPMPIAETASTFCETIVKNSALLNADKETALMILESDLQDNSQVIVDILSRFIFEDTVFEKRKNEPLSVNELCNIMIDAQNKTYGKGLDSDYMHKYMWVCKPHYYDAAYNYYNFPYAFGLLLAKGLYALYEKSPETFPETYKELLSKTGKGDIKTVALSVGIDISNIEFWRSSLEIIKRDIEKFINL